MSASSSGPDFLTAYESACNRLFTQIHRSCAAEQPWPARVRESIIATLALFAADPALASTLLYEVDAEGPEAQLRHEETLGRLIGILRQGREEVDSPPLPEHIEEGLIGGLLFLIGRMLRAGEAAGLPSLAPDLTTMLLTPYLGQNEAERLAHESI